MSSGWERVLEYAKMSENAYGENALDVSPWEMVDAVNLAGNSNTAYGGYGAVAYYNPLTGEIAIAHRGTDDSHDLVQDFFMYTINYSYIQGLHAERFTAHIKAMYPGATKITHTGHSLGGSLANYMAKIDTSSKAIAFDPLGTAGMKDTWNQLAKGKSKYNNILNLLSDPNIVNGAKPHAGKVVKLGNKNQLIPNPVKSHSLSDYIIPLIEAKVVAQNVTKEALAATSDILQKLTQPNVANVYIPRQTCQANAATPCLPNTPTAQELAELVKTYRPRQ